MLNCHLTRISSEEKNYGLLASCQHFFFFFLHGGGLKSLNTHISSRYGGEEELVAEIKKMFLLITASVLSDEHVSEWSLALQRVPHQIVFCFASQCR